MAKFIKVNKAPEKLGKEEYIIKAPEFSKEIEQCKTKQPMAKKFSRNYLRDIISIIGMKYIGLDNFDPFSVNISNYVNRPFETDEEINTIVCEMLSIHYPAMFNAYVNYNIQKRPYGTKLIYFLGSAKDTTPFFKNGIDEIQKKDLDIYMGRKTKRIIGKPMPSQEEINAKKTNLDTEGNIL